jgi:integrase
MVLSLSLWENFLSSRSQKTKEAYEDALKLFLTANNYPDAPSAIADLKKRKNADEKFSNFLAFLKERGLSPSSIALYSTAIRQFLTLYDISINPVKLRALTPRRRLVRELRPLSKDDLTLILPLMRPSKRLFVWFLFATGCRANEAARLKIKDINLDADPPRAVIESEKTYRKRIVFIPNDLAQALRRWIEGKSPEHYVFHNERGPQYPLDVNHVRSAFQSALRRTIGMRRDPSNKGWQYSLHSLRKTFKTILQTAGMDGLMIELLLGHDTGIDRHYYLPSLEEMAAEWKKYEDKLLLDFEKRTKVAELEDKVRILEDQVKFLLGMIDILTHGEVEEKWGKPLEKLSEEMLDASIRIDTKKPKKYNIEQVRRIIINGAVMAEKLKKMQELEGKNQRQVL